MEVLPNAYIDRGSIVQMETKSKIKKSSLPELCSMHYNFIIFNFECTLFLSKFFKNKDHKVTVPKLYELPVFLRLIYDSLQRVKINNISEPKQFSISPITYAHNIYRGDKGKKGDEMSSSSRRRNIYELIQLANIIESENGEKLLEFSLAKNSLCTLTVYPAFMKFAKQHLISFSKGCLKIFPAIFTELAKLRKNSRAYAFFIENLYAKCNKCIKGKKADDEESQSRIKILFFNPLSTHFYTFAEIKDCALKGLKKLGVSEELLEEFANLISHTKDKKGQSPIMKFMDLPRYLKAISMMIKQSKTEDEIKTFISSTNGSTKQLKLLNRYYEKICHKEAA